MPAKKHATKAPALDLPPDLIAALLDLAGREKMTPAALIAGSVFGARLGPCYTADRFDTEGGTPDRWYLWQAEAAGNLAAWWLNRGLHDGSGSTMIGAGACELAAACPDLPELLDYLPGSARAELLSIPEIAAGATKGRKAARRAA